MVMSGGLRARLIRDSLEELVRSSLDALGWFDAGRQHAPIRIIEEPNDWDEPIEFNSISVSGGDLVDAELELGSTATEDTWTYYCDCYMEDESVAIAISGDIREALRGKLPDIGRTGPVMDVYDFRDDPPDVIFTCELQNIIVDRGRGFSQPWLRYWFTVRVEIVDENFG
jgi:hypothetical protein